MSFHNSTEVKRTRRTRRCGWCSELIHKSHPSVATAGSSGGDFYQGRYHPECSAAIYRWCKREGWGDELPYYAMNRGGIEEQGEPETESIDQSQLTTQKSE